MAAHEISGDGSFDLDASPASRLSRCVVCLESKEVRVSTCADVRHGICGGCLSTALLQPKRRNPLTNADGSMGCVAAGCSGRFELRALLDVLETPEAKKHVLTIVAELRRASAPAAAQQTRRVDPKTDASKLETKRKQMLAAVDFMRKPSIASRPKESIDEYLRRNGVEDDVIAVARDVADGKRDAAGVVFEEETPAAPEAPAATGGTAHAPTFDFASSAAALAEIDAIWAETEKLISCDDLASLLNKLEHTKKKTLKRAMRDRITARANDVATQLQSEGWAVLDDFCAPDLVTRVLQDIAPVEPFYEASEIWVGADSTVGAQVSVPSVRGDRVLWMCGAHPRPAASADFTRNVDERGGVEPCEARVKDGLNKAKGGAARLSKSQVAKFAGVRDLFKALDAFVLGELVPRVDVLNDVTSRSDGMLAIYPGDGARFQAHVDNTTADGRRLTVLCYFNTDWAPDAGGALRVHPPSGPRDIAPKAGRVAIFYSKTMKHEVRPNRAHRTSVTLWYYSDGERREAVERSKEDAGANRVASSATDAERLAAQKFAKELCAPDAPRPDALAIADLAARAAALPAAAQHILAGMAGVPETHFAAALRRLEPDDLVKLRNRFANMGV